MEFIIRNHKISDLWFVLMTIFNNSCIFYYIFLMPCCGILLRHFALYINLSRHRWDDFSHFCFGLMMEPSALWAAVSLSKRAPKAGLDIQPRSGLFQELLPRLQIRCFSLPGQLLSNIPLPSFSAGGERNSTVGPLFPSSMTFCLETRVYLGYCSSAFFSGEHSSPFWDH